MASGNIKKSARIKEIISVIRRHNALSNFSKQIHPQEVRQALEELGPTFIKIGQILSTRPDLMTPEYIHELHKLQDQVPVDDYDTVSSIYQEATGKTLEATFSSFEHKPFASASIGQVHHATLPSGENVVVKIQHPAVAQLVTIDLNLLHQAVKILRFTSESKIIDIRQVYSEIKSSLINEIDTSIEAKNGQDFYKLNNGEGIIRVPRVYPDLCAPRILVNEAMPGSSIRQYLHTDHPVSERRYIVQTLVTNFIKQIFTDRFFHADPHPGNILVAPTDDRHTVTSRSFHKQLGPISTQVTSKQALPPLRLIYLDFGMMGRISPLLAANLRNVVTALALRDEYDITQAVLAICNQTGPVDHNAFRQELAVFLKPFFTTNIVDLNLATILFDIVKLCRRYNLQIKSEAVTLIKAVASLESTIAQLDPNLSLLDIARPFALKEWLQQIDLHASLQDNLLLFGQSLQDVPHIPRKINHLLDTLESGQSQINLHHTGLTKFVSKLERLTNRIVIAIILAAVILGSSLLVQVSADHPYIARIGITGYCIALTIILGMLGRSWYDHWRKKHHRK